MEISCLELSLSLSKTLLSLSFVLARVCMCSTPPSFFLLLILFQIKNLLSQKALSLSLSLAFFGSLMLSADDDDDQNGDDRAAAATREDGGELVVVVERRQLVYVESWFFKIWRYKSKMFLSYFSRFVLLLRRYSRYAFALGTTAIAIGAIVVNTNRRME